MPTIPIKDLIYALLLTLVVGLSFYFTHHERAIGEREVIAADQRTVLVAQAKDQAIEAAANQASQKDTLVYEKVVSLPPVGDLGLVCKPSGAHPVPSAPAPVASGAAEPASVPADVRDPSGDLLTVARSSDAFARDLQAQINILRQQMAAAAR